jgi:NAD(P)H-quinone oxidoreductase subunit 5
MFAKKNKTMIDELVQFSATLPFLLLLVALSIMYSKKINFHFTFAKYILIAGFISVIPLLYLLFINGEIEVDTLLISSHLGLYLRFDALSVIMFMMVSAIGYFVLRYSITYLQGDPNRHRFIKRLLFTIAFVQLFVISGSIINLFLMWVATSISLHYLIVFYKERKEAKSAVKKKFVLDRISDLSLLAALFFLYKECDNVNLDYVFNKLQSIKSGTDVSLNIELSGVFLLLAAIIKSVQIPFHSWILNVMEAPTPVSALLHAGLLNAGPFLIIRFAYILDLTPYGSIFLIVIGGISALFGAIVFPVQPSIKTSLAYSSIGHMGFSLMLCGLGLYSAALLHLIAHSFYKAHSFLSSGSAIDKYRLKLLKIDAHSKVSVGSVFVGFVIVLCTSLLILELWGGSQKHSFQFITLLIIIVSGVSSYFIKILSLRKGWKSILYGLTVSGTVILSFFIFEYFLHQLLENETPRISELSFLDKSIILFLLGLYLLTILAPIINYTKKELALIKWEVYKRNGFYIHIIFDRLINKIR